MANDKLQICNDKWISISHKALMGRITASRKQLKPDPMYGSLLAAKFINCLMLTHNLARREPARIGS